MIKDHIEANRFVLVEIHEIYFEIFTKWLSEIRIADVELESVVSVQRVYRCFLDSQKEYFHE